MDGWLDMDGFSINNMKRDVAVAWLVLLDTQKNSPRQKLVFRELLGRIFLMTEFL